MMTKRRTPPLRRNNSTFPGATVLLAVVMAMASPHGVSGGTGSAQAEAIPGTATFVPLAYQETSFACLFRDVPVERRLTPFRKEPALAPGPVVRGVFKFGANLSNAVAYLWQGGPKKLFLDLNRNQDLTDDPAGVVSAQVLWSARPSFIHQMFTNVPLAFPATSAGAPMRVDLRFTLDLLRHPGEARITACLRSYWQGKVTWGGHDWQVGLLQNLSGQPGSFQRGELLLRPWEERDRPFCGSCEIPEDTLGVPWERKNLIMRASEAFAFSPKVFFGGHACQLDWSAEPRGREERLALRLTEQQTPLGELRINGSLIRRLVLTGGPYVVVLAQTPASVKVPPGRYHPYRVWLKQDKAEAYFNFGVPQSGKANVVEEVSGAQMPVVRPPRPAEAVVVAERQTAALAVGGPLTNCVSATRRGGNLLLSYRLIGAGGGEYRIAARGDRTAPRFTVSRSGNRIGSGQFEFG